MFPARHLAIAAAGMILLTPACDRKASPGPQAPAAPTAAAPAPSAPASSTNWATVTPVSREASADVLFHLARLADVWSKSAPSTQLWFENDSIVDHNGHSLRMTAGEWKGVLDIIKASPGGRTANRAAPAGSTPGSKNYGDGLGKAPRRAYDVITGPDNSVILTVVKPLDGESDG